MGAAQLLDQATLLHQAGRLSEAETVLRRALTAEPRVYRAHFLLAKVLQDSARISDAISAVDAALLLSPNSVDAIVLRADMLDAVGRSAEALVAYTKAVARRPALGGAWFKRGVSFQRPDVRGRRWLVRQRVGDRALHRSLVAPRPGAARAEAL